jgi:hypothetical protein
MQTKGKTLVATLKDDSETIQLHKTTTEIELLT